MALDPGRQAYCDRGRHSLHLAGKQRGGLEFGSGRRSPQQAHYAAPAQGSGPRYDKEGVTGAPIDSRLVPILSQQMAMGVLSRNHIAVVTTYNP